MKQTHLPVHSATTKSQLKNLSPVSSLISILVSLMYLHLSPKQIVLNGYCEKPNLFWENIPTPQTALHSSA
jgi:hypothetical protein